MSCEAVWAECDHCLTLSKICLNVTINSVNMLTGCWVVVQHVSIASLLVLLLGTLLSTIQQTGEVMAAGINYINPNYTGIMVQGSGRLIMLISMIVVAPLSLLRELREVILI